jgi:endonuclease YncB( thermonuclease family)
LNELNELERRRRRKRAGSWLVFVIVWLSAAALGTAYGAGWFESRGLSAAGFAPSQGTRAHFPACFSGGGHNCVVDGDTIWLEGQKVRIADIDTPETHEPKCASEKALGDRAAVRLQELLNSGSVTLHAIERDEDRYGRKLRIVLVDGVSVGDTLVAEGLARWYGAGRKPWC